MTLSDAARAIAPLPGAHGAFRLTAEPVGRTRRLPLHPPVLARGRQQFTLGRRRRRCEISVTPRSPARLRRIAAPRDTAGTDAGDPAGSLSVVALCVGRRVIREVRLSDTAWSVERVDKPMRRRDEFLLGRPTGRSPHSEPVGSSCRPVEPCKVVTHGSAWLNSFADSEQLPLNDNLEVIHPAILGLPVRARPSSA